MDISKCLVSITDGTLHGHIKVSCIYNGRNFTWTYQCVLCLYYGQNIMGISMFSETDKPLYGYIKASCIPVTDGT